MTRPCAWRDRQHPIPSRRAKPYVPNYFAASPRNRPWLVRKEYPRLAVLPQVVPNAGDGRPV
jgi:hypothetical protein